MKHNPNARCVDKNPDLANERRQFINKFGKLAVVTPVALTALMSPSTSAAPKSTKCDRINNKHCT